MYIKLNCLCGHFSSVKVTRESHSSERLQQEQHQRVVEHQMPKHIVAPVFFIQLLSVIIVRNNVISRPAELTELLIKWKYYLKTSCLNAQIKCFVEWINYSLLSLLLLFLLLLLLLFLGVWVTECWSANAVGYQWCSCIWKAETAAWDSSISKCTPNAKTTRCLEGVALW